MKYKVGDRVKVYDICQVTNKSTEDNGSILIVGTNRIMVKMDTCGTSPKNEFWFHPKQCRKLIKKKTIIKVPGFHLYTK